MWIIWPILASMATLVLSGLALLVMSLLACFSVHTPWWGWLIAAALFLLNGFFWWWFGSGWHKLNWW